MNIKKILPFILVAVVFVVAGYFIGKVASPAEQSASIYGTTATDPCAKNPTIPCNGGGAALLASSGVPTPADIRMRKCIRLGGTVVLDSIISGSWHCEITGTFLMPHQVDSFYAALLGTKEPVSADSIQKIRNEVVKYYNAQTTKN